MIVEAMREADLDAASAVHLDAFRGYMNARFGRRYARAMLRWFMNADRGIALVARDADGTITGYVAGAPVGYNSAMTRALIPVAATSMLTRPWLLFSRTILRRIAARFRSLSRKGGIASAPQPDVMSLVAIGVASGARGRGVGELLMKAFERDARALGMRAMRLSVYDHNVAARRLYERAGWSASATEGTALYFSRDLA